MCMLCLCPKLYCIPHWNDPLADYMGAGLFTDWCPEAEEIRIAYGILSVITMLIFSIRMMDFVVMSNTMTAYMIMAGTCFKEVCLFLAALSFSIFAFSSATLALFETNVNFKDIPAAALTYLEMSFALFDPTQYDGIHRTVVIFILIILFQISIYVFLINLLVAQLCSTHHAMYEDIVGYARLRRIETIYATFPYVLTSSWKKWVNSLQFDTKLEFNVGDIGLAGGIQVLEPANANPTTVESILRFGGSTSPLAQWPDQTEDMVEGEAIIRLEKAVGKINHTLDRLVRKLKIGGEVTGSIITDGSNAANSERNGDRTP
jgi:hypothetical protein